MEAVSWTIGCRWIKQFSPPWFSSFLKVRLGSHTICTHWEFTLYVSKSKSKKPAGEILPSIYAQITTEAKALWWGRIRAYFLSLPDQVRVDSPDPHFSFHLEKWEKLTEIPAVETSDCWAVQLVFCFVFALLCWSGQPHRGLAEGLKSKKEKTRMHIMTHCFLLIFPTSLHAYWTLYLDCFISISQKDWLLLSPKSSWLWAEFSTLSRVLISTRKMVGWASPEMDQSGVLPGRLHPVYSRFSRAMQRRRKPKDPVLFNSFQTSWENY